MSGEIVGKIIFSQHYKKLKATLGNDSLIAKAFMIAKLLSVLNLTGCAVAITAWSLSCQLW